MPRRDIGTWQHRAAIYKVTTVDDGAGGRVRQDTSDGSTLLGWVWCFIQPVSAKERVWGDQLTEQVTHYMMTRYREDIEQGSIIKWNNVEFYAETVTNPDGLKRFMKVQLRQGGPN